jgi:hypothetical protein
VNRPDLDPNLVGWRNARRYGVAASMVTEATCRREAGDWRGACAAAGFDVRFSLEDVRDRHGAEAARWLDDDLSHLAPDLVRWHVPRQPRADDGLLQANLSVILARYPNGLTLWADTPVQHVRPQRIELKAGHSTEISTMDTWVETRDLWDARAADGLLARIGGVDRAPFFTRDGRLAPKPSVASHDPVSRAELVMLLQEDARFEQAWAAGGITARFPDLDKAGSRWSNLADFFAMVPALATALRQWAAPGQAVLETGPRDGRWLQIVVTVTDADISAELAAPRRGDDRPVIPRSWWQRLPELELLRRGQLELSGLHPLVRAALFPDNPGGLDDYRPLRTVRPQPVAVRCRGEWHRIGWRDGRAVALDHTAEEARREAVLHSLGGEVPRCFSVTDSWRRGGGLPRPLRDLRRHALLAIRHGDAAEFIRVLDLGLDPAGVRDRWDRDPLHYAGYLNSVPLLHRLLLAGLDVNRRDRNGRAPLMWTLADGARSAIVEALLDAGADPTVRDRAGDGALHLLRSRDAATFLPRLLAAGLGLEERDKYGRTPLMTQLHANAPAEAIRALWQAGADPFNREEYSEQTVADLVEQYGRTDLDFLPAGARDGDDND